jgi:dienelactone hydrolase
MHKMALQFVIGVFVILSIQGVVQADDIALPDEVHIVPPTPDIPHTVAAFGGAWIGGAWDGVLPHALIVEHLTSDGTATVVYAYGDAPEWRITRHWLRTTGTIAHGQLRFALRDGKAHVRYTHEDKATLLGFYDTERAGSFVRLTKTEATTSAALHRTLHALQSRLQAETIAIPLTTRDAAGVPHTIQLEATLYRPARVGRLPLVIFKHGSTGPGVIPPSLTLRYEAQAHYFLQRGYAVLSPMRKGRGRSEGTYAEPYQCNTTAVATGVASAMEDVDGVLEFMLHQSYVDTDQLLLAGISRGGYWSVVYAGNGKYRGRLKGVINFVGGWMGDGCGTDLNSPGYTDAAPHISFPTLWLYATGDAYYSPQAIQGYVRAYTAAGGRAQVTLYDTVPGNGHRLPMFVSLWKPAVDQYLAAIGFARQ